MRARILSGIVITVLTIVLGIMGGLPLGIVLMFCAMVAYYELTRALNVHDASQGKTNILEIVGLLFTVFYYIALMIESKTYVTMTNVDSVLMRSPEDPMPFIHHANSLALFVIMAVFLIEMAIYAITFPRFKAEQVLGAIFSFLYAPLMISCIYRAEFLPYGLFVFALIFFCSWISDTCAYAVGTLLGRHKMAPILSPHKTVEGAIGGIAGSIILCLVAAAVIEHLVPGENLYLPFALIGAVGSIIGIIGDLAASAIKRNHGLKDYGKAIPGHGGFMDRFDSVIFTAPVIYFLGVIFLTLAY